jgi:hypothetical protein
MLYPASFSEGNQLFLQRERMSCDRELLLLRRASNCGFLVESDVRGNQVININVPRRAT